MGASVSNGQISSLYRVHVLFLNYIGLLEVKNDIYLLFFLQDTEVLLQQLERDREAVNEVRAIVEHEESIMKKETQIVQDYSEV